MIPVLKQTVTTQSSLVRQFLANPSNPKIVANLFNAIRSSDQLAAELLAAAAAPRVPNALSASGIDREMRAQHAQFKLRGKLHDSSGELQLADLWVRGVRFQGPANMNTGIQGCFDRWPIKHLELDLSACSEGDLEGLDSCLLNLKLLSSVESLSLILPSDEVLRKVSGLRKLTDLVRVLVDDCVFLSNLKRLHLVGPPNNQIGADELLVEMTRARNLKKLEALWVHLAGGTRGMTTFFDKTRFPSLTDLTIERCKVCEEPEKTKLGREADCVTDALAKSGIIAQLQKLQFIGCDVMHYDIQTLTRTPRAFANLERLSVIGNSRRFDLSALKGHDFPSLSYLDTRQSPTCNADKLFANGIFSKLLYLDISGCVIPSDDDNTVASPTDAASGVCRFLKLIQEPKDEGYDSYPLLALNVSDCGDMDEIVKLLMHNDALDGLLKLGCCGLKDENQGDLVTLVENYAFSNLRVLEANLNYGDWVMMMNNTPSLDADLERAMKQHSNLRWISAYPDGPPYKGLEGYTPFRGWRMEPTSDWKFGG